MAKSRYFIILLLGACFSACNHFSGNSDSILTELQVGDTVKFVKYETRDKTIYTEVCGQDQSGDKAHTYIDTLKAYLGTREATGNNDGVIVERFTREACKMGQVAWCAAFVAYGLKVTGTEIPDCACWSPCMVPESKVVWRRGDKHKLEKGHIFGLYFKSKGRVAHVGAIIEDYGDGSVQTIEGNTDDAGSREGNGVFIRLRHRSQLYVAANWITE